MEPQKLIPVGKLFKKSFEFYKGKLYLIMVLALIPFANFVIISILNGIMDYAPNKAFLLVVGFIWFLFFLVTLVVSVWIQATFFYLVKERDSVLDAKSLLKFSWKKLIPYSWVLFLMGIISIVGFLLLIIPGIIVSVMFSMALYMFVFEDARGMQALYKSKDLVKGYWWPVFGRLFLFGLLGALISSVPVIGDLVNIFVTMPLGVIYAYFIYENLKTVKSQPSIL
ncbi:MAG: hypothetical protein EXS48_03640 [Candidatus Staskawiczbacteria bacterium]|nr:hypothetical protein [Candidatus Staskawiczbacteria bacterium]